MTPSGCWHRVSIQNLSKILILWRGIMSQMCLKLWQQWLKKNLNFYKNSSWRGRMSVSNLVIFLVIPREYKRAFSGQPHRAPAEGLRVWLQCADDHWAGQWQQCPVPGPGWWRWPGHWAVPHSALRLRHSLRCQRPRLLNVHGNRWIFNYLFSLTRIYSFYNFWLN